MNISQKKQNYEFVGEFVNGVARARIAEYEWQHVDRNLQPLYNHTFAYIAHFGEKKEGLASVKPLKPYGDVYINKKGEIVEYTR